MNRHAGACLLYYSAVVHDAHGRVIRRYRRRISQSFVANFLLKLYLRLGFTANQSFTDTGGSSRSITTSNYWATSATVTTSTYGLVVGTGTNAVTINDTKLQTQVAHGVGAGQLQYGASVTNLPAADATGTSLILTRDFSNGSGGTITVKEIGIYVNDPTVSFKFCLARDLATISITNGSQLTLNYEMRTLI